MNTGLLSLGTYLPETVIDNDRIAQWTGADAAWVTERTGVLERRYCAPGTTTSEIAHRAAARALDGLPQLAQQLQHIVVATSTPDQPQPSTAVVLQDRLGLPGVPAFDVNAVCSGFLYGLSIADSLLTTRSPGRTALVVGADIYSTMMDRTDRRTVSLFGDGAGAVVLGPVPEGYGIRHVHLTADGAHREYVEVVAGGTRQPLDAGARERGEHLFRMRGREVRDYAMRTFPKVISEALAGSGLRLEDIGRFVFHQANTRLIEACVREMGIDPARVPLTAPFLGNTAAASIPLTLHHEHGRRPFERGEHVLLAAVGGGMTAGAAVVTWY
ncbi:3-oxoacyl-ACP synthase III family protein [Streptomyces sp. NPDC053079]|uniref:3-oxoacyl-ACP synthase III family protein n=1 Tax=Streptomyces sp. NPDC053079 TaxID=3365697 RepID=UPI0037CD4DE5